MLKEKVYLLDTKQYNSKQKHDDKLTNAVTYRRVLFFGVIMRFVE